MQWTNPNTGSFVWSRTASDLTLGGITGSGPVRFTVTLNGSTVASFDLIPVSGQITLRFREILEAILPRRADTLVGTNSATEYVDTVAIQAAQDSSSLTTATMRCFRGGSDELRDAISVSSHWLTWKPLQTRTWPWAKEFLSCVVTGSVGVNAKIYFSDGSNSVISLASFSSGSARIGLVNCSPSRIISAASGRTVLAYDVYSPSLITHRFILKSNDRARGREFLFMNSLGALDTVIATGDVSRETEMAVSSISVYGDERELGNAAVEKFKVQTGGIRERRTMDQWQEFFRASERYVLLKGDVVRRIVVDSIEPEMTEHKLSGAAFTYHYAKAFTGRFYQENTLGAFDSSSID